MQSTSSDLAKLAQMLLNRGAYGEYRFFSEAAFEQMLPRPLTEILGAQTDVVWGIGLVRPRTERLSDSAFGHFVSEGTLFWIDPAHDLVIVLTRTKRGPDFNAQHNRFLDILREHVEH